MAELEFQATMAGIESYGNVRKALIALRGRKLDEANFEEAVLLSHVIWWLTVLGDENKDATK